MQRLSQKIFQETRNSLLLKENQHNVNPSVSPTQIIGQVNEANQPHVTEIVSHADENHESSDKELGSYSSFYDTFYKDDGSTEIKSVCNFAASEFHELSMMLKDHISPTRNVERGRKINLTEKDFLCFVCVQAWKKIVLYDRTFRLSSYVAHCSLR